MAKQRGWGGGMGPVGTLTPVPCTKGAARSQFQHTVAMGEGKARRARWKFSREARKPNFEILALMYQNYWKVGPCLLPPQPR